MSLFRRAPRPAGSRFIASFKGDHIELWWNDEDEPDGTWLLLRSEKGFADDPLARGQVVVLEGPATHVSDRSVTKGRTYYYSLFLRDHRGSLGRCSTARIRCRALPRWWPEWGCEWFIAISPGIRRSCDGGCVGVITSLDEERSAERYPP